MDKEAVNHPIHYGGGDNPYEHIKVSNAWGLNYELGNATKYICRAGKKTSSALEDLKKARWYIDYEIKKMESVEKKMTMRGVCHHPDLQTDSPSPWCPDCGMVVPARAAEDQPTASQLHPG